ncbi:MAG TPA: YceI family protein [Actinomycetota bacterium]|nr:YceI family protein [Actinomycetota bacterium]
MRQRRKRTVGIVAAALIVAIAGAYAAFVVIGGSTSAAPPVSLSTATPSASFPSSTSGGVPASFNGTWTLARTGSSSFVGYRVREQFSFLPAPSVAVGRTTALTGSLTVSGLKIAAVSVKADLTQLHSDKPMRDERMQTMGLETDRFPSASFTLTSPVSFAKRPPAGTIVRVVAHGNLSLHGVTRSVSIPLQARWSGDQIQVVGSLPIVFADYGITPPSIGPVTVQDHGTMELQLVFAKST